MKRTPHGLQARTIRLYVGVLSQFSSIIGHYFDTCHVEWGNTNHRSKVEQQANHEKCMLRP